MLNKMIIIIALFILYELLLWLYDSTIRINKCKEDFGALQSLYSNDGIQDLHLTVHNDRGYYDPYRYWRGIPWNLPTRNLNRIVFYPYLYEYYVDRYARLYPYW